MEKGADDERVRKEIMHLTGVFAADPHPESDVIPEYAVSSDYQRRRERKARC